MGQIMSVRKLEKFQSIGFELCCERSILVLIKLINCTLLLLNYTESWRANYDVPRSNVLACMSP